LAQGTLFGWVVGHGLWVSNAGGSFADLTFSVCDWNLTVAWLNRWDRRYRDQTDPTHQYCSAVGSELYYTRHYVAHGQACIRLHIFWYARQLTEVCHAIN